MTDTFTRNFQLTKPDFNISPWHAKINDDLDKVDAIMFRQIVASSMTVWANATEYAFGDIVIDTDATFWLCQTGHTSRVAGTMADDRADNPTYWTAIALSLNPRGAWTPETLYIVGDIVFETASGITAICRETHTSSAAPNTIEDDSVYWDFIVQVSTPVAADVEFDNAGTSLLAENVQAALEELDVEFVDMSDLVNDISLDLSTAENDIDDLEAADILLDGRVDALENAPPASVKDYAVNGHMMVSQQNGTTAGTTTSYHPADQWAQSFVHGGTSTIQNVASTAPIFSPRTIRVTATVADAAVAAGDYLVLGHQLEGYDVADLLIGTADAKTITIGFYVKAPAGTYFVTLSNGAQNRSYPASYTISGGEANTKVRKSVTIALDQTGTWLTDNGSGLRIWFGLMCGTSFAGTANAWAASALVGGTGQFNVMGTVNNIFELSDVVIVEGSDDPGPQPIDYERTLMKCQRYWCSLLEMITYESSAAGATALVGNISLPQQMRTSPTVNLFGVSYLNASGVNVNAINNGVFRLAASATGAGAAYVIASGTFTARL